MYHKAVKLSTSELRCHMQYTGMFKTTGLFLLKVNSIFSVYSTCKIGTQTTQRNVVVFAPHATIIML